MLNSGLKILCALTFVTCYKNIKVRAFNNIHERVLESSREAKILTSFIEQKKKQGLCIPGFAYQKAHIIVNKLKTEAGQVLRWFKQNRGSIAKAKVITTLAEHIQYCHCVGIVLMESFPQENTGSMFCPTETILTICIDGAEEILEMLNNQTSALLLVESERQQIKNYIRFFAEKGIGILKSQKYPNNTALEQRIWKKLEEVLRNIQRRVSLHPLAFRE